MKTSRRTCIDLKVTNAFTKYRLPNAGSRAPRCPVTVLMLCTFTGFFISCSFHSNLYGLPSSASVTDGGGRERADPEGARVRDCMGRRDLGTV